MCRQHRHIGTKDWVLYSPPKIYYNYCNNLRAYNLQISVYLMTLANFNAIQLLTQLSYTTSHTMIVISTSKNNYCVDQKSLKSMCFDLAWPHLSSGQGVIAFSTYTEIDNALHGSEVWPGETTPPACMLFQQRKFSFANCPALFSYIQIYGEHVTVHYSLHFIIKQYGGTCFTRISVAEVLLKDSSTGRTH